MNAARFPALAALLLAAAACGKSEPAAEEKPKEEKPPEPTASASPGLDLGSLGVDTTTEAAPPPPPPAPAAEGPAPAPAPETPKPDAPKPEGPPAPEGPPKPPPPSSPDEITEAEVLKTWSVEEREALNEMKPAEREEEIRKARLKIFKERGGVLDTSTDASGQKKVDETTGERGAPRPKSTDVKDLPPPALQDILSDLASKDPEIRARGADSAGRYPDKAVATRHLAPLLKDKDEDLRQLVAATLGSLGQEDAVAPLAALVERGDKDPVRTMAIKALHDIPGPASTAALRAIVREGSEPADRADALAMLIKRKNADDVKDLVEESLKSLSPAVRRYAVVAIREFKLKEREADLAPLMEDFSEQVIMETMRAYGDFGTKSAVKGIVRVLLKPGEDAEDPEGLQNAANEALVKITGEDKGFAPDLPDEKREEVLNVWKAWWDKNRDKYK
jgi:HEAT repeat protein